MREKICEAKFINLFYKIMQNFFQGGEELFQEKYFVTREENPRANDFEEITTPRQVTDSTRI